MEHLDDESTDLKLHTHLCAERYKGIQDEFERLTARMDKIENKVDSIHSDFTTGQKSLKTVIITTFGSVVVALIGLVGVLLTR